MTTKVHYRSIEGAPVNVKDFGAVGDGVTDDSAAFIAATLAGPIYIPKGTYVVQGITTGNDMWGKDLPELILPASATQDLLEVTSNNVTIDGIKFNGNGSNNQTQFGPLGIQVTSADSVSLTNNHMTNFFERHIMTDGLSPNLMCSSNRFYQSDFELEGSLRGDVIVVRSSGAIVQNNHFSDIGNGHCVRTGTFPEDVQDYVENVLIDGNTMLRTKHVGCTLEEYSRNIVISNNVFDTLEQAVKCERSNEVCSDITVIGNSIKNLSFDTALNLRVPRVIFSGNTVSDILDGPTFGDDFICSNNYFKDSGRTEEAFVSQGSEVTKGGVISGNVFEGLVGRGIAAMNGVVVQGNSFTNITSRCISVTGDGCNVVANTINTATYGVVVSGTAANCVITSNSLRNLSTAAVSDSGTGTLISSNAGVDSTYFEEVETVSGAVAVSLGSTISVVHVKNESDASTVNVTSITGVPNGKLVTLRANSNSELQVYQEGGNLQLAGSASFTPASSRSTITFLSNGSDMLEVSRSDNS